MQDNIDYCNNSLVMVYFVSGASTCTIFFILLFPCEGSLFKKMNYNSTFNSNLYRNLLKSIDNVYPLINIPVSTLAVQDIQSFPHTLVQSVQNIVGPIQVANSVSSKFTVFVIQNENGLYNMESSFWDPDFYFLLYFMDESHIKRSLFNYLWDRFRVYKLILSSENMECIFCFNIVNKSVEWFTFEKVKNCQLFSRRFPNWNNESLYTVFAGKYTPVFRNSRAFLVDFLVMKAMSERLNLFPVRLNTSDEFKYGFKNPNGSYSGTFRDLVERVANVTENAHLLTYYDISEELRYSTYSREDKFCISVPKSDKIPHLIAALRSFNFVVSCSLLLSYVAAGVALSSMRKFYKRLLNLSKLSQVNPAFTMFGLCIGFPVSFAPRLSNEKFFLAVMLLASLVVVSCVQSTITSILSTPPTRYRFPNSREELNRLRYSVWTSSSFLIDSYRASGYTQINFHKKTVSQQNKDLSGSVNYKQGILEKMPAGFRATSLEYMRIQMQPTDACGARYFQAYVYPRGSPHEKTMNHLHSLFVDSGLMNKWEKYVYTSEVRAMQFVPLFKEGANPEPLTLDDLLIMFQVFAVILSSTSIVLALELVVNRLLERRARKHDFTIVKRLWQP